MLVLASTADFIANDKPLYCELEDGRIFFPVLRDYAVSLGMAEWDGDLRFAEWKELSYRRVLFPPIPYSAQTIDRRNRQFVSPFGQQRIEQWSERHWLGTDRLGRDVLAGMLSGVRVAIWVGLVAMGIASVLGVFMGVLSGYFGNDRLSMSWLGLGVYSIATYAGAFLGFIVPIGAWWGSSPGLLGRLTWGVGWMALAWGLGIGLMTLIKRRSRTLRTFTLPMDTLVMRFIELVNAIPGLFLILAIASLIRKPSLIHIMVIIGCIAWTGIARFMRAELLRLKGLEFVDAARVMGLSDWRILSRHLLPNALGPVLITIAFGIASAILTEATLSFLGIGVPPEQVTWGSLLKGARSNFQAWWLALFPGAAIFLTVTAFNLLGDALTQALDPKSTEGNRG
jgi:peptide/nickel transport system permease protein